MKPEYIFLHCSDSPFGSAQVIDSWHKERGFNYTLPDGTVIHNGYNFIIGNGNGPSVPTWVGQSLPGSLV